MAVVVALLRAVNVGRCQIRMDALRSLFVSLGFPDARTYIQSGNVVFRSTHRDLRRLSVQLQDAIEETFSYRITVVLRTASELGTLIAENPFTGRPEIPPNRLFVLFMAGMPDPAAVATLRSRDTSPEEVHIAGRHL